MISEDFFNLLHNYASKHSDEEDLVLQELSEETIANVPGSHMISGHLQGLFLELVSKLIRPKCILEIGTYTGYASINLAKGLADDGKLITIEKDHRWQSINEKYWQKAGLKDKIDLIIGDAHQVIKKLEIQPDLIFLDADKKGYIEYTSTLLPMMKSGSIILADNVLFKGEVLLHEQEQSKAAKAMDEFNKYIKSNNALEVLIMPLRDGISIIRKK